MDIPYLEFFGLLEAPYSTSPNPRFLYISPTHNVALQKTKWTITAKEGLALCFGKPGTGKTTLAREMAQLLEDDPTISYVFITNPNYPTPNQLLRAIVTEFKVGQTARSYLELLDILKRFLITEAVEQQKTLVLIIDEANTLKPPMLEMIRQIMNYESNDQKFIQIVLFAQEEFRTRLYHPRYRNIVSRVAMSSTLENLSLSETHAMLRHRWMIAGGQDFPFTDEAVNQIYAHSHGIPRTQVILAGNAVLAAYLSGTKRIETDLVTQVILDRGLPDTAPESPASIKKKLDGSLRSVQRKAANG